MSMGHPNRRRSALHLNTARRLCTLTLSICCGVASAQGLRLSQVLEVARGADAQFAAARAAADASREKRFQAIAGLRPTVTMTHSTRFNRDGSTAYAGTQGYDGGSTALVLSQPLFRLANQLTLEQAELQVRQGELQLALAEQDLLLRVAKAYFDVLQGQDELTVARAQQDALQQQLAQARRTFEVGTVPITDLNEAQSRHDIAVAQVITAGNELESRKRVLERSLGRRAPALARLKDGLAVEVLGDSEVRALVDGAALAALPTQLGQTAVALAELEIRKRDAGHTPTLDLVASLGVNRNINYGVNGGTNTRQSAVGFEFTFPVYQGGAVNSRVREAQADRRRADEELLQAQRQALLDAQQAQLGVESGAALTRALQQAVASSESLLRSVQRGQQVGIRTRVDVLNAEQQLYVTRRDLAGARYRTLVASLQLKAAAGALSTSDLLLLDALLTD